MKGNKRIFILDDDELILETLSRFLKMEGYDIHAESRTVDIANKITKYDPDIVLLDISLPELNGLDILNEIKNKGIKTQVVMLTADDTADTAVRAMKLGAADYVTKPFSTDELKIVIKNVLEKEELREEVDYLRKTYSEIFEKDLIGESRVIRELKLKIEKMAKARVSTILITGESGTGKEIAARHIHNLMFNTTTAGYAPFISINCAAMPESLLESELFGYQKGSFTDAKTDKKGLFELAEGGSILLDEIGDMKPDLQSKLLRVVEERKTRRIGGQREILIDAVVITTTNKNLSEAVEKGEFRKDLFFRMSTFYIHIRPLRERSEDIPLLVKHFLEYFASKYNKRTTKGFSPETEKILVSYNWPGNVRELKNLMERFVVLENIEMIQPEHLPNWLMNQSMSINQPSDDKRFLLPDSGISLKKMEKDLILQALEKAKHNKTRAAMLLNISYDALRYQLKKFGLK